MYYIILESGNYKRVHAYTNRAYANIKFAYFCEMYFGTNVEVRMFYSEGRVKANIVNDFDNFIKYTY